MSDGSAVLRFLSPDKYEEIGRVTVTDDQIPVRFLNELEFIRGEVYANVWHSDKIARIALESGRVVAWIDLQEIMPRVYQLDPEAVLNGIAWDDNRDRLFVTGKLWPKLFEIRVKPTP
jgi:glutamine cyclotransferase